MNSSTSTFASVSGFSYVPAEGFLSMRTALVQNAWGGTDIAPYDVATPPTSLLAAPAPVRWKLRLTLALRELDSAKSEPRGERLRQPNRAWTDTQRQLHHRLSEEERSEETPRREAAARLRECLLQGKGLSQTTRSYEAKIEYGRSQVSLARQPPCTLDVALLGLGPLIDKIEEKTESFALKLGYSAERQQGGQGRFQRLKSALVVCREAFDAVTREIDWSLRQPSSQEERDMLRGMLAPLLALLLRFPATSKKSK